MCFLIVCTSNNVHADDVQGEWLNLQLDLFSYDPPVCLNGIHVCHSSPGWRGHCVMVQSGLLPHDIVYSL